MNHDELIMLHQVRNNYWRWTCSSKNNCFNKKSERLKKVVSDEIKSEFALTLRGRDDLVNMDSRIPSSMRGKHIKIIRRAVILADLKCTNSGV